MRWDNVCGGWVNVGVGYGKLVVGSERLGKVARVRIGWSNIYNDPILGA